MAKYGPSRLRSVYEAQDSFDSTVSRLFHISVDSLETVWLNFAAVSTPDSLVEQAQEFLEKSSE